AVVACEVVGAHRDPAPLLELVEAAFDDVAAAVAGALLFAEVDRTSRLLAPMGDLVVSFGDRRRDPALSQPCPVGFGRVALVGEDPIGSATRPAFAGS